MIAADLGEEHAFFIKSNVLIFKAEMGVFADPRTKVLFLFFGRLLTIDADGVGTIKQDVDGLLFDGGLGFLSVLHNKI